MLDVMAQYISACGLAIWFLIHVLSVNLLVMLRVRTKKPHIKHPGA